MKTNRIEVSMETGILSLIILMGALLRFSSLGILPLTNSEAELALSALHGTKLIPAFDIPHISYAPINSLALWVLASLFPLTDVLPRILPAVTGSLMLFVPFLLKKELGSTKTIVFTFLLAFSPLLITISRTSAPAMVTATAVLFFAAAYHRMYAEYLADAKISNRMSTVSAVTAGIILASGKESITAGLIAAAAFYLFSLTGDPGFWRFHMRLLMEWVKRSGWLVLITCVLVAAGAGLRISGISELFSAVGVWLSGWSSPSDYPPGVALSSMVLYEPAWILAAGGFVLALVRRCREDYLVLSIFMASVLLFLIYPGRSGPGMVWLILSVNALAGLLISRLLNWFEEKPAEPISVELIGAVVVFMVLFVFAYLQAGGYVHQAYAADLEQAVPRLTVAVGAAATAVVVLVFFGMGWGWKFSGLAAGFSVGLLLLAGMVSSTWHLNFLESSTSASEVWRIETPRPEMTAMKASLERISTSVHGDRTSLTLMFSAEGVPALAWYMRDFKPFSYTGDLPADAILVPAGDIPATISDIYTGRTDAVYERKGWMSAFPPDLIRWWFNREAPVYYDEWALLVRSDLILIQVEPGADMDLNEQINDESYE